VFGDQAGFSETSLGCSLFDRNGTTIVNIIFDPRPICKADVPYETQVLSFSKNAQGKIPVSPVLGSALALAVPILDQRTTVGTATLDLVSGELYRLRPSANDYTMNGLPFIGFEAIDYLNANVTPGVLANYSHATSRATVPGRSDTPTLLRQAPNNWNVDATYDRRGWSARIGVTHNDANIYAYNYQPGVTATPACSHARISSPLK
jgi:hypothetical protein